MTDTVRIGSRGSELALWQARWVQTELQRNHPDLAVEVHVIRTRGDRVLDSPLSKIGDKGLFTREIENALLDGKIDLAVHSLKDLPTELPGGLTIGAICRREDVRDVFIPHPVNAVRTLMDQPHNASIATGSLRRKCQLMALRPDCRVIEIRGNLNTRMKKLEKSDWAGMILARAGVLRLGWESSIGENLEVERMLPAVGQGALGVEVRASDAAVAGLLPCLHDSDTAAATLAERALLRRLGGGCQVPIGAFGRLEARPGGPNTLILDAMVGSLDGRTIVRGKTAGSPAGAEILGRGLAEQLLADGADRILQAIRVRDSSPAEDRVDV